MYNEDNLKIGILIFGISIIIIFISVFALQAGQMNGRLEMCKELGMVYTHNEECITLTEFNNLQNKNNIIFDESMLGDPNN